MDFNDYFSDLGKNLDREIKSLETLNGFSSLSKSGILMTDIDALAEKCGVSRSAVEHVLMDYCMDSELVGIHWDLLDASPDKYDYIFEEYDSWEAYSAIIEDFIIGMDLTPGPHLGLFIIGGDDIIPMPKMDCPIPDPELTDGKQLDVDYLYCLSSDEEVRCNVGRLPLENGPVPDGLDRIESYFLRSLGNYDGIGLDVENGVVASCKSCLCVSMGMIRDLPIEDLTPEFGCTYKNIFVSPSLDKLNPRTQRLFNESLGKADFLLLVMHGSNEWESVSYSGQEMVHGPCVEAFTESNMAHTSAKIINTVACFGGRYIDFDMEHSLLLQGIYGPALLYTASCASALGSFYGPDQVAERILMPTLRAETFLRLYNVYLYLGMNAGEALLKAKQDYLETCGLSDGKVASIFTVLEFNLFGNPLLNMKPKLRMDSLGEIVPEKSTKSMKIKSVVREVRTSVDDSISEIKSMIVDTLYKNFNLNPKDFSSMEKVEVDGKEEGYVLKYSKDLGPYSQTVFAKTDMEGKIIDIIQTI